MPVTLPTLMMSSAILHRQVIRVRLVRQLGNHQAGTDRDFHIDHRAAAEPRPVRYASSMPYQNLCTGREVGPYRAPSERSAAPHWWRAGYSEPLTLLGKSRRLCGGILSPYPGNTRRTVDQQVGMRAAERGSSRDLPRRLKSTVSSLMSRTISRAMGSHLGLGVSRGAAALPLSGSQLPTQSQRVT